MNLGMVRGSAAVSRAAGSSPCPTWPFPLSAAYTSLSVLWHHPSLPPCSQHLACVSADPRLVASAKSTLRCEAAELHVYLWWLRWQSPFEVGSPTALRDTFTVQLKQFLFLPLHCRCACCPRSPARSSCQRQALVAAPCLYPPWQPRMCCCAAAAGSSARAAVPLLLDARQLGFAKRWRCPYPTLLHPTHTCPSVHSWRACWHMAGARWRASRRSVAARRRSRHCRQWALSRERLSIRGTGAASWRDGRGRRQMCRPHPHPLHDACRRLF